MAEWGERSPPTNRPGLDSGHLHSTMDYSTSFLRMIYDVSLKKTFNRSLIVGLIVKCLLLICRMWSVESQIVRPMKVILHKST